MKVQVALKARSLVVSDLVSETKGSRFEVQRWLPVVIAQLISQCL